MRSRTGFHIAAAALLLFALYRPGLAQDEPADADDEQAEAAADDDATADDAADADAEQPKPKVSPAASGAGVPRPVTEVESPKSTAPLSIITLTNKLDAIKAQSDRLRARVDMLKDAVLQGGKSANAVIVHRNKMGDQFRLTRLSYTIDGTVVYSQRDDDASLHDKKVVDILSGPVAPGSHTIAVSMTYRGHGYGPFKYLNKQTFTVKGSQTFKAVEGKSVSVDVLAFERKNVPLEQRPAVSFKVSKPQ